MQEKCATNVYCNSGKPNKNYITYMRCLYEYIYIYRRVYTLSSFKLCLQNALNLQTLLMCNFCRRIYNLNKQKIPLTLANKFLFERNYKIYILDRSPNAQNNVGCQHSSPICRVWT